MMPMYVSAGSCSLEPTVFILLVFDCLQRAQRCFTLFCCWRRCRWRHARRRMGISAVSFSSPASSVSPSPCPKPRPARFVVSAAKTTPTSRVRARVSSTRLTWSLGPRGRPSPSTLIPDRGNYGSTRAAQTRPRRPSARASRGSRGQQHWSTRTEPAKSPMAPATPSLSTCTTTSLSEVRTTTRPYI